MGKLYSISYLSNENKLKEDPSVALAVYEQHNKLQVLLISRVARQKLGNHPTAEGEKRDVGRFRTSLTFVPMQAGTACQITMSHPI